MGNYVNVIGKGKWMKIDWTAMIGKMAFKVVRQYCVVVLESLQGILPVNNAYLFSNYHTNYTKSNKRPKVN